MSERLDALAAAVCDCKRCKLSDSRRHLVFGTGAETAAVMLVGEAPGEQEDLQGKPFVGPSGQLLDLYLNAVGLDRGKNVYIANILKCRPPYNRDPAPEEIGVCLPWLREQVKIIRPAVIVCLGRIAATTLISPDFRVTRQHGQFFEKGGIDFMGTFHPSALLRDPAKKGLALYDFLALEDRLRERGIL